MTILQACVSLAAMRRSRLAGILIGTPAAQAGAEVDFWSAALAVQAHPEPGEEQFTGLAPRRDLGEPCRAPEVGDDRREHVNCFLRDSVSSHTRKSPALAGHRQPN
jgi:hypothetical protein